MTEISELAALIERFAAARVLTVGDVMLDRYVSGAVDRISPEAPIPVLAITGETAMLGGAGNVARNLAGLGGAVSFVSAMGDDDAGAQIGDLLAALGTVRIEAVADASRRTTIKTRYVSGSQQLMRADHETATAVSGDVETALVAKINIQAKDTGALVLSDYGKGVLTDAVIGAAIAAAGAEGIPVIVDPKGRDYTKYSGADVVTPNKKELSEATGLATETDDEVVAAARALMRQTGVKCVLATRSGDGMTLVAGEDDPIHMRAEAREVFDVSGAGDTVAAVLALALAAGAELADAARLANAAAGVVVGKAGTAWVSVAELSSALHHQDLGLAEAKLLTLEQARARTAEWNARGYKVGFTNGCFDLLHPGHISLLSQSRAACDRLVVGLNSDASVKRLKGETRPIQSEAARAAVLGALSAVDAIVIFSEDTPVNLIETLKPGVLVKGADYTIDTVVGADIVQSYGGEILLASLIDGHSTTSTVKRIGGE